METIRRGWIPHNPTDKQLRFLLIPDREAFYGGAAGGGKSDALLMAALMYVDQPSYAAILFRRTLQDHRLPEGLIPRSHSWLGGKAHWNGGTYTWTFPSGSTITFGYMDTEMDHFRYQSSAYQYIGFDELPQFDEDQYRYLFSRLRRLEGVDVPLRMRGAGNPGGIGHLWVKARFIDQETRVAPFIPARLDDNPYLDKTEYVKSLNMLNPVTRAQLLEGDWNIHHGGMFRKNWFTLINAVPNGMTGIRYWDMAASDEMAKGEPAYTAGVLMGLKENNVYVVDMQRARLGSLDCESLVKMTALIDRQRVVDKQFNSVYTWMEEEPGSAGKGQIARYATLLRGHPFKGDRVTGSKATRAAPFASYSEAGNVYVMMAPWTSDYLDELAAFPEAKIKDQVDASSGAFNKLTVFPMRPKVR